MVNWLIFASFIFSAAMTLMGVLVDLTYQLQIRPRVQEFQSIQKTELEKYLQKKKFYQNHPVFNTNQNTQKNFADLYEKAIDKGDGERIVPPDLKREFFSLGDKWLEQKHKVQFPQNLIDLFDEINEYDHWTPRHSLKNSEASDLIVSTQLFLAYTYYFQPHAVSEALKRTRRLAQILLSVQDLNFKLSGLSLLEKEQEVMDFLNRRLFRSKLLWTPISRQELRNYRKFLAQTGDYLNYISDPKVLEQVFIESHSPVGFCSLVKSKIPMLNWSRAFLENNFPFEPRFSSSIAAITKIIGRTKSDCHAIDTDFTPRVSFIKNLPYYRRLYVMKMILDANQPGKIL